MNRFIFSSSGKTKSTSSQEVKCNRTVRPTKESIRETLFAGILLRQSTGKPKRGNSLRGNENPASSARSPSISAAKPCSPKRTMITSAKCNSAPHSCFSQPTKARTKAELNNNQEAQPLQDRTAILVFQTFCDSAVTLARQTRPRTLRQIRAKVACHAVARLMKVSPAHKPGCRYARSIDAAFGKKGHDRLLDSDGGNDGLLQRRLVSQVVNRSYSRGAHSMLAGVA